MLKNLVAYIQLNLPITHHINKRVPRLYETNCETRDTINKEPMSFLSGRLRDPKESSLPRGALFLFSVMYLLMEFTVESNVGHGV